MSEYSEQQLSLLNTTTTSNISFNEFDGDYIKIIIYDTDDNYLGSFQSNYTDAGYLKLSPDENQLLPPNDDAEVELKIYRDSVNIPYIKPAEILNQHGFASDTYKLKIQFLNDVLLDVNSFENFNLLPNPVDLTLGTIYNDVQLTNSTNASLEISVKPTDVPPELQFDASNLNYLYEIETLVEEDYSVYTQQIDVSSVQNFLTSKPLTFAFRAKKTNTEAENINVNVQIQFKDVDDNFIVSETQNATFEISDDFELFELTKGIMPASVNTIQVAIYFNKADSDISNNQNSSIQIYGLSVNIGNTPMPFSINNFVNPDFNNNLLIDVDEDDATDFQNYFFKSKFFRIAQISPSRKEVRLSPYPSTNFSFDESFEIYFTNKLQHTNQTYNYDFALQVFPETSIAINSFLFDKITTSNNFQTPSIILRLNETLPDNVFVNNEPADNIIVQKLANDIETEIIFIGAQSALPDVAGLDNSNVPEGGIDVSYLNPSVEMTNSNLQNY